MKSSVSNKLVSEIAYKKGVEASELKPVLYEKIDPDALNTIFAASGPPPTCQIEFDYAGYRVSISADQEISLTKIHDEVSAEITAEAPSNQEPVD